MGTSLTGVNISSSYLGLLKTTDSAVIGGTAKIITDGNGNDSPLYLSTTALGIGITPTSTLHVNGDANINNLTLGRGSGNFSSNTVFGQTALANNTTGEQNIAIGDRSLSVNTEGEMNTAVGKDTLRSNTTGDNNTAIGRLALQLNTIGDRNVALGNQTLGDNLSGEHNVGLGYDALTNVSSGDGNIGIGYEAGSVLVTGNNNIIIGKDAEVNATSSTNEIVIGYNVTGNGSNTVTIGNSSITTNHFSGDILLGNSENLFWGNTSDVYISGTTVSDNIQLGVGGSTQFTFSQASGLRLHQYGGGTITGTATQRLGVDSSGNVIEIPIGAGAVDGSGTAGRLAKWTDSDTLGNSGISDSSNALAITINGNEEVGIGVSPLSVLHIGKPSGSTNLRIESGTASSVTGTSTITMISRNASSGTSPSIKIESIFEDSNDSALAFHTTDAGTTAEKMRLDSSGRLGLGTSSPDTGYQLTLSDSSTAGLVLNDTGQSGNYQIGANGTTSYWRFDGDNTKSISLNSTGNVGVGVINASAKLEISHTDTMIRMSDSDGTNQYLELGHNNGSSTYVSRNNTSMGTHVFYTANGTSATERMRIDSSGRLGIGLTPTTVNLEVKSIQDSSFDEGIGVVRSNSSQTGYINMVGGAMNINAPNAIPIKFRDGGNTNLTIGGDGNATFAGNVNITGSSKNLVLANSNNIRFENNAGAERNILTLDTDDDVQFGGSINNIRFLTDDSSERMRLDSLGNLGIGTSSPDALLDLESSTPALRITDTDTNAPYELKVDGGTFSIEEVSNSRTLMSMTTGAVITLDSLGSNTVLNTTGSVVVPNGSVGIGTSSPSAPLSIQTSSTSQTIRLIGRSADGSSYIQFRNNADSSNYAEIGSDNNSVLLFNTNGSEAMRLDSSGRLGLGTSSPDGNLEVIASTVVSGASDTVNNVLIGLQSANRPTIILDTADTTYTNRTWNITNVGSLGSLAIGRNGLDVMTMKNDGNVGIGTTNPSYKLDIEQSAENKIRVLATGNTSSGLILQSKAGATVVGTSEIENSNVGNLLFKTGTTSASERMRITNTALIWKSNDIDLNNGTVLHRITNNDTNLLIRADYGNASANSTIQFHVDADEKARITSGGALCVGKTDTSTNNEGFSASTTGNTMTTATTAVLNMNRKDSDGEAIIFRRANTDVGSIDVTTTATSYNTSSDYRLKEDLQDFNALEIASKIKMYDFKWKADDSRSYGVMAHELEEVLPQAVSGEKDGEEMQSVDYSKLVPILLKSIQELKAEIDELKKNK